MFKKTEKVQQLNNKSHVSTRFCHISNETHKLDLQRQTGTQNKYKKCFYCLPNVKSDAHCGTRINTEIKSNRKETKRKQWASWRNQERLKNMRVMGQQQGLWVRGHRLNAHTRERDKAGMDSVKTIMKAGKGTKARQPQEELTFRNKHTDKRWEAERGNIGGTENEENPPETQRTVKQ